MKFVPLKSNGVEVLVNPAAVFAVSKHKNLVGNSIVMSITGVAIEVEGSLDEIQNKLEGNDKAIY